MKKPTSWLLIANSSLAKIYKIETIRSLAIVETFEHPESRLHNRDLVSDKPGRDFESFDQTRHSLEPHTTPKQNEFNIFAKHLASYLDTARNEGKFEKLYISAPPSLLGLLRQFLHTSTAKLVCGEVNKDMTHMTPDEIMTHLPFFN
ncbi:host attachment protein [Candidatus Protochlamydia sp. W-9]|uniref:host attachment protein n=1 Tax=Candidatus Protochlamydia sp. W-9 TaxID=1785087 RepID=UPI00096A3112|nr:host attachment protein [Candidatus Protochlamydia sp. W-9]